MLYVELHFCGLWFFSSFLLLVNEFLLPCFVVQLFSILVVHF